MSQNPLSADNFVPYPPSQLTAPPPPLFSTFHYLIPSSPLTSSPSRVPSIPSPFAQPPSIPQPEPQQSVMGHNITLYLYVPTSKVGAIIGRSGSTITHLHNLARSYNIHDYVCSSQPIRSSNVRITIPSSTSAWSSVVIKSEPMGAFQTCREISTFIGDTDGIVVDVPVHRSRHATIIGSKGTTIRKLSADNNVRISVPDKLEFLPSLIQQAGGMVKQGAGGKREVASVQFEGEAADCEQCIWECLNMIHEGVRKHEEEKRRERMSEAAHAHQDPGLYYQQQTQQPHYSNGGQYPHSNGNSLQSSLYGGGGGGNDHTSYGGGGGGYDQGIGRHDTW
ncbi:hypothetical protein TL16_g11858 [Triparma laevis f. inornata]|uniref:K Homology domain-containing protein n=1 Tax=Triparma laevis f. inornata TaxID=1714386 RepID=A0A9W7EU54_9STRA|nr:hypothetical protein TL16_g11858 [Triparma laevis f. inornata]